MRSSRVSAQQRRPKKAIVIWQALVDGTRDSGGPLSPRAVGARPRGRVTSAPAPRGDGWEGFPVRGSYAQGVAWIVMILARALHYAHRHADLSIAT